MSAAKEIRICRDEDCPSCGWPETVAIGLPDVGPNRVECNQRPPCGWAAKVVDGVILDGVRP